MEADKMKKAMHYAKHSLEIEGRHLSKEGEKLIERQLSGEINEANFLKEAKELAQK